MRRKPIFTPHKSNKKKRRVSILKYSQMRLIIPVLSGGVQCDDFLKALVRETFRILVEQIENEYIDIMKGQKLTKECQKKFYQRTKKNLIESWYRLTYS